MSKNIGFRLVRLVIVLLLLIVVYQSLHIVYQSLPKAAANDIGLYQSLPKATTDDIGLRSAPPAFLAAAKGDTGWLKRLLKEDVDPNKLEIVIFDGRPEKTTLLIIAISYQRLDSIDLILNYQADPNLADEKGCVPLDYASMLDKSGNTTKLLLEKGKGINPDHRNAKTGMTPLLNAALFNNYKAAEPLLEAKVDPNVKSKDGNTPLTYAKHWRQPDQEFIDLLKRYGAKEEAEDEAETKAKE